MRSRVTRCLRGSIDQVLEAYEVGRATTAVAPAGIDPATLEAARRIEEALQGTHSRVPSARRQAPTRPPGRTS